MKRSYFKQIKEFLTFPILATCFTLFCLHYEHLDKNSIFPFYTPSLHWNCIGI